MRVRSRVETVEDAIHPWRWRALTVWIVAFSLLTAYALYAQRRDAEHTDRRFCEVTSATISASIKLRDQLNKNDIQTIGRRKTVQEAARNGSYVFSLAPASPVFQAPVRNAILQFFAAIDDLNASQVVLGQEALAQSSEFVDRLGQLRRRLRCRS